MNGNFAAGTAASEQQLKKNFCFSSSLLRSNTRSAADDPTLPALELDEHERRRISFYMGSSVASSTSQGYDQVYKKYEAYCQEKGVPPVPAPTHRVSAFIVRFADETQSWGQVRRAAAAIAKAHEEVFAPRPTDNDGFRRLLKGIQRKLDKPAERAQKTPFTPELLSRAVQTELRGPKKDLVAWRTVWRMLMEFHALARWSDVVQLEYKDIYFGTADGGQYMRLTFRKSKTDQAGKGTTAFIRGTETSTCPVHLTREYARLLGYVPCSAQVQIMQPRIRCIRGQQTAQQIRVSYTTALEDLRRVLTSLGEDPCCYGEHSGRRGGATTAASRGASEREVQEGGRWASDSSMRLYVSKSVEQKLSFSDYLKE